MPDAYGLYLVMTDPVAGYAACAEAAVQTGVRLLQLRMKREPRDVILRTAREVAAIVRGSETRFFLNDDPALAIEAGADGFLLWQSDMPLAVARLRFRSLCGLGFSPASS